MSSFLQSVEWLDFQKSLGRKAWRFDNGRIKANIIRHDLFFRKNYLYIPHGPEIDFNAITGTINNEVAQFVAYLKNLAKEQYSMFVKIEPLDDKVPEAMHQFKFRRSSKEVQPNRTVIIDLSKSEEELLASMHQKTRYNIKVAEKHGIQVSPSDDFDAFWKLLNKTAKRDKFSSHTKDYYKQLLEFFSGGSRIGTNLILASLGDKSLAGAIILTYGDTAYYLHGASDHDQRQMMAPYKLHWGIIQYLKNRGFKSYDLWGINAIRWPGVTRFKLGWLGSPKPGEGGGNRQVEYSGSFDLRTSRFWYFAYKLFRTIFRR